MGLQPHLRGEMGASTPHNKTARPLETCLHKLSFRIPAGHVPKSFQYCIKNRSAVLLVNSNFIASNSTDFKGQFGQMKPSLFPTHSHAQVRDTQGGQQESQHLPLRRLWTDPSSCQCSLLLASTDQSQTFIWLEWYFRSLKLDCTLLPVKKQPQCMFKCKSYTIPLGLLAPIFRGFNNDVRSTGICKFDFFTTFVEGRLASHCYYSTCSFWRACLS